VGSPEDAAEKILSANKKTGLALSGFSISNNFYIDDPEKLTNEINRVIAWIRVAAKVKAPVSRIFGGHLEKKFRSDENLVKKALAKVTDSIGKVVKVAEQEGVVLALENHGALPGSGEHQVGIIKAINSRFLRATVDIGNYMEVGQDAFKGTEIAAPYCAYVHYKDCRKVPDKGNSWGWESQNCLPGKGDANTKKCMEILKKSGYNGYVALEYEVADDEETGIPASVAQMQKDIIF
jgi:hydroxypyruvate isomerase